MLIDKREKEFLKDPKKLVIKKNHKKDKGAIQKVHTPYCLCEEIVQQLVEYNNIWDNKDILVMFNAEFIPILIEETGVNPENIWFMTFSKKRAKRAEIYYKVNTIVLKKSDLEKIKKGKNIMDEIKKKFKVIVGNPPYQANQVAKGKRGGGALLWPHFLKMSLQHVEKDGYVCLVHPALWRKPEHFLWDEMKSRQIEYLEIHNTKDGQATFGAGTRYDWYVLQNSANTSKTIIVDENGKVHNIDLQNLDFLANYCIDDINKILAKDGEDTVDILYSRSNYGNDKAWMSREKDREYRYPCVHATNKKGIKYLYSSTNKNGFFGTSKVIFGDSGVNCKSIIDMKGKYGLTEHAFGITVKSMQEAKKVKNALDSEKFTEILKACIWSNFAIEWRVFKYFRKDFWKDFV